MWDGLVGLISRHKKRRPWTSLIDHLVGRGNLNLSCNYMILLYKIRLIFYLEYFLEYQ